MADPRICASMGCFENNVPATVVGTFLSDVEGEPDKRVGYCAECAKMIGTDGMFVPDTQRPLPELIVERVAIALWMRDLPIPPGSQERAWAAQPKDVQEGRREQARVALAAALTGANLMQDWVVTVEHTDGHDEHPAVSRNAAIRKADRFALAGGRASAAQRWTVTFIQPVMRAMGERIGACQYNASPHQLNDECVNVETA